MKNFAVPIVFFLFSFCSSQLLGATATTGQIYLQADATSFVGRGIGAPSVLWSHGEEGVLSLSTNNSGGAALRFDDGNNWSFTFVAPTFNPQTNSETGNLLQVRVYENATRFPFNSPTRPGMNFSGGGKGNNKLGGWFQVHEVEYDGSSIQKLAIDFRQFDESEEQAGPSTFGSIRFNSLFPINTSGDKLSVVDIPGMQGLSATPSYDIFTRVLTIPRMQVLEDFYELRLVVEEIEGEIYFAIDSINTTN